MDTATIAVIISGAALLVTIIGQVINGSWNLSTRLLNMEKALRDAISESKTEIEERQDAATRQFAETLTALRQKINDVELEAAKVYMRRDSFYKSLDELKIDWRVAIEKIERALERLEQKFDK